MLSTYFTFADAWFNVLAKANSSLFILSWSVIHLQSEICIAVLWLICTQVAGPANQWVIGPDTIILLDDKSALTPFISAHSNIISTFTLQEGAVECACFFLWCLLMAIRPKFWICSLACMYPNMNNDTYHMESMRDAFDISWDAERRNLDACQHSWHWKLKRWYHVSRVTRYAILS